jgi:hypothetical protein
MRCQLSEGRIVSQEEATCPYPGLIRFTAKRPGTVIPTIYTCEVCMVLVVNANPPILGDPDESDLEISHVILDDSKN